MGDDVNTVEQSEAKWSKAAPSINGPYWFFGIYPDHDIPELEVIWVSGTHFFTEDNMWKLTEIVDGNWIRITVPLNPDGTMDHWYKEQNNLPSGYIG